MKQGYRYDLTDEEAQELGRRSIVAAGHRDAYSGNSVNLYHVRENGWEFISKLNTTQHLILWLTCADNYDLSELWYKYQETERGVKIQTMQQGMDAMAVEP